MKVRLAESDVVKFLRAALAERARPVTELEASARAAGLLDRSAAYRTAQRNSDVPRAPFGSTRFGLALELVASGYGSCRRRANRSANAGRQTAPRRLIPSYWVGGVARLRPDRPPNDVPRHRWAQFVQDCTTFLSPSENWAERAYILGWDAMALFGCAPRRPLDYSGCAGLLWAINGGRLVELHRDWAVIDVPLRTTQRIFSRRNVDQAKITLPWAMRPSSRQPAALGR